VGGGLRGAPAPSGHKKAVTSLAFSASGGLLASGSEAGSVGVWDVRKGRTRATLAGHDDVVTAVGFATDGRRTLVVSAGKDEAVRLWDPKLERELEPRLVHDLWVYSLAVSPDGRLLASGSADRTVRLWELSPRRRREVARLTDHDGWVTALGFAPDGETLAVGTQAGTLQLWSLGVLRTPGRDLPDRARKDFGLDLDGLKVIPLRESAQTAAWRALQDRTR